jgi:hypothetical protein
MRRADKSELRRMRRANEADIDMDRLKMRWRERLAPEWSAMVYAKD